MEKILVVQNILPHYRIPFYNALGKQYDITYLHSGDSAGDLCENFKEVVVKCSRIGPFYFQKEVLKTFKKGNYKAVVLMFDLAWVNNLLLALLYPKKVLFWGHGLGRNSIGNKVRNILVKKVHGIILYSERNLEDFVNAGVNRNHIFIANNTVLISNHGENKEISKNNILFVGRTQKSKKVDELIEMFAEVIYKLPEETKLVIVGEGAEDASLKKLAIRLKVTDRVVFKGEVLEDHKLREIFHSAFVYASPGPVGLGVLHSFAYGLPVLTFSEEHHGPEVTNIQNNVSGFLCKDREIYKSKLIEWASNSELTQKMGANAYCFYKNDRNLEQMVKEFSGAVRHLLINA